MLILTCPLVCPLVVSIIGPLYFDFGASCVEASCNNIGNWPPPTPGECCLSVAHKVRSLLQHICSHVVFACRCTSGAAPDGDCD